jgi:hypothetical protein
MISKTEFLSMTNSIFPRLIAVIFLCSALMLGSCGGMKPATSGSGKSLYESFYAGDGTIRYFIKPLELESADETILIDFNVVSSKNDTATAIFSIFSEQPLKTIDRIEFKNDSAQKVPSELEKMFIELEKNNYESRYSAAIPNKDMKSIFGDHNWKVIVESNGKKMTFTPKRKTQKKIITLNKAVFMLVE